MCKLARLTFLTTLFPLIANAETEMGKLNYDVVVQTGPSALWILANISYAGMRAQGSRSAGWRIVAFIFGFPGTLLSLLLIRDGCEHAYGIDLPRR
ncbi:MAG: hypothetical protein K1Y02_11690 [Candidatus Hydrogenedentes bacterium]|nr:hypothetical protein [Candidatus Hydrogenedentota bacterium]